MAHAFLNPSSAHRWTRCLISPWREKEIADISSAAADEGTAAHFLRDACLTSGTDAKEYIGLDIAVFPTGDTVFGDALTDFGAGTPRFAVNSDMVRYVQTSIDTVRALAKRGELFHEQELDIGFITGEEGATGTADAVILNGSELTIEDLKYGRGVQVFAEENEQLLMYAAAALEQYDLGEIETVRMCISQPRLDHQDTWSISVPELHERTFKIHNIAAQILEGVDLEATPGDKQCRFCKARGTCEEYRDSVLEAVSGGFVDLGKGDLEVSPQDVERVLASAYGVKPGSVIVSGGAVVSKPTIKPMVDDALARVANDSDERLATVMDAADMIEQFVKAVRAEVERRLLLGQFTDSRYKLVGGKKGSRAWRDAEEAETALKDMRLKVDEMYDKKVKSPTQIEKLLGATPRRWAKIQQLITQADGKPSVAPASDKRAALTVITADSFEPLTDNDDLA